jgi:hypothetical protein
LADHLGGGFPEWDSGGWMSYPLIYPQLLSTTPKTPFNSTCCAPHLK